MKSLRDLQFEEYLAALGLWQENAVISSILLTTGYFLISMLSWVFSAKFAIETLYGLFCFLFYYPNLTESGRRDLVSGTAPRGIISYLGKIMRLFFQ